MARTKGLSGDQRQVVLQLKLDIRDLKNQISTATKEVLASGSDEVSAKIKRDIVAAFAKSSEVARQAAREAGVASYAAPHLANTTSGIGNTLTINDSKELVSALKNLSAQLQVIGRATGTNHAWSTPADAKSWSSEAPFKKGYTTTANADPHYRAIMANNATPQDEQYLVAQATTYMKQAEAAKQVLAANGASLGKEAKAFYENIVRLGDVAKQYGLTLAAINAVPASMDKHGNTEIQSKLQAYKQELVAWAKNQRSDIVNSIIPNSKDLRVGKQPLPMEELLGKDKVPQDLMAGVSAAVSSSKVIADANFRKKWQDDILQRILNSATGNTSTESTQFNTEFARQAASYNSSDTYNKLQELAEKQLQQKNALVGTFTAGAYDNQGQFKTPTSGQLNHYARTLTLNLGKAQQHVDAIKEEIKVLSDELDMEQVSGEDTAVTADIQSRIKDKQAELKLAQQQIAKMSSAQKAAMQQVDENKVSAANIDTLNSLTTSMPNKFNYAISDNKLIAEAGGLEGMQRRAQAQLDEWMRRRMIELPAMTESMLKNKDLSPEMQEKVKAAAVAVDQKLQKKIDITAATIQRLGEQIDASKFASLGATGDTAGMLKLQTSREIGNLANQKASAFANMSQHAPGSEEFNKYLQEYITISDQLNIMGARNKTAAATLEARRQELLSKTSNLNPEELAGTDKAEWDLLTQTQQRLNKQKQILQQTAKPISEQGSGASESKANQLRAAMEGAIQEFMDGIMSGAANQAELNLRKAYMATLTYQGKTANIEARAGKLSDRQLLGEMEAEQGRVRAGLFALDAGGNLASGVSEDAQQKLAQRLNISNTTSLDDTRKKLNDYFNAIQERINQINARLRQPLDAKKPIQFQIGALESQIQTELSKTLSGVPTGEMVSSVKNALSDTTSSLGNMVQRLIELRKVTAEIKQVTAQPLNAHAQMTQQLKTAQYKVFDVAQQKMSEGMSFDQVKTTPDFKNAVKEAQNLHNALKSINDELGEASAAGPGGSGGGRGIIGGFIRAGVFLGVVNFLASRTASIIQSWAGPGFAFAKNTELATVGLAGILSSMTRVNGATLTWGQSLYLASDTLSKIQNAAATTGLEVENLQKLVQSIMGAGLGAQMSIDQIVRLGTVGGAAIKQLGLPDTQFVQEMRDLVQGGIQVQSSVLATQIGVTDALLNQYRSTGQLYNYLMTRLEGFAKSQKAYMDTLEGKVTLTKFAVQKVSAAGMDPVYQAAKDVTDKALNYLGKIDEKTGEFKPNVEVIQWIRDLSLGLIKATNDIIKMYTALSRVGAGFSSVVTLGGNVNIVGGIFKGLTSNVGTLLATLTTMAFVWKGIFGEKARKEVLNWSESIVRASFASAGIGEKNPKNVGFGGWLSSTAVGSAYVQAAAASREQQRLNPVTSAQVNRLAPMTVVASPDSAGIVGQIQKMTASIKATMATAQISMLTGWRAMWAGMKAGAVAGAAAIKGIVVSLSGMMARTLGGLILSVVVAMAGEKIYEKIQKKYGGDDAIELQAKKIDSISKSGEAALKTIEEQGKQQVSSKGQSMTVNSETFKDQERVYAAQKDKIQEAFNNGEITKEDFGKQLATALREEQQFYIDIVQSELDKQEDKLGQMRDSIKVTTDDNGNTVLVGASEEMQATAELAAKLRERVAAMRDQLNQVDDYAKAKAGVTPAYAMVNEDTMKNMKTALFNFWEAQIDTALERSKAEISVMETQLEIDKNNYRMSIDDYYKQKMEISQRAAEMEIKAASDKQQLIVKQISSVMSAITYVLQQALNNMPKVQLPKGAPTTGGYRDMGATGNDFQIADVSRSGIQTIDPSLRVPFQEALKYLQNDASTAGLFSGTTVTSTLRPESSGNHGSNDNGLSNAVDIQTAGIINESLLSTFSDAQTRNYISAIFRKYGLEVLYEITDEEQKKFGASGPNLHITRTGMERYAWNPSGANPETQGQAFNFANQFQADQAKTTADIERVKSLTSSLGESASVADNEVAGWLSRMLSMDTLTKEHAETLRGLVGTWGGYAKNIDKASEALQAEAQYNKLDAQAYVIGMNQLAAQKKMLEEHMEAIAALLTKYDEIKGKISDLSVTQKGASFDFLQYQIPTIDFEALGQARMEGKPSMVAAISSMMDGVPNELRSSMYKVLSDLAPQFTEFYANIARLSEEEQSAAKAALQQQFQTLFQADILTKQMEALKNASARFVTELDLKTQAVKTRVIMGELDPARLVEATQTSSNRAAVAKAELEYDTLIKSYLDPNNPMGVTLDQVNTAREALKSMFSAVYLAPIEGITGAITQLDSEWALYNAHVPPLDEKGRLKDKNFVPKDKMMPGGSTEGMAKQRDAGEYIEKYRIQLAQLQSQRNILMNEIKNNPDGVATPQQISQLQQLNSAMVSVNDTMQKLKDETAGFRFGALFINIKDATDKLRDGLETTFTNIIEGTQSVEDSFRSLALGVVKYIQQMIIKQLAWAAASRIMGMFTNMFGGAKAGSNLVGARPANVSGPVGSSGGFFTPGAATGGLLIGPGTDTSDNILARLSPGEFVNRAVSVRKYGAEFFHRLNQGLIDPAKIKRFATGGLVDNAMGGLSQNFSDFKDSVAGSTEVNNRVQMNVNGVTDAQSFRRSQGQIMADMNRMLMDGRRNM